MYIDAHAHLDKYETLLPQVIQEIERHEILTVSVSMNPEAYARNMTIGKQSEWVVSTFGVHPWDAAKFHAQLEAIQPLIDASPGRNWTGL